MGHFTLLKQKVKGAPISPLNGNSEEGNYSTLHTSNVSTGPSGTSRHLSNNDLDEYASPCVATDLWKMFFRIFGLKWVVPETIKEALMNWSMRRVDETIKRIWLMIPAAIF
ncbi:hypothetical protein MTR67_015983 [Solanum verrucosum]|uniref:Uncharacterized protein n=1 Tax=Solanum verrucosum TaxID=315347 RepID=A0AAF0TPT8_SOLVR|nr:hypothetical protein MTR67_015983 [Solanum verrucosum]